MAAAGTDVGPRAWRAILDEAHRRKQRTLHLDLDRPWLETLAVHPDAVLRGMEASGLLRRVGEGRYVLATPGTKSALQNAPAELLAALAVRHVGSYYIGFLTALIEHRLTDFHSSRIYVAVPQGQRVRGKLDIDVRPVQVSSNRWPTEDELERVRVIPGTKEFVVRSGPERTLVDAINRPELSGGFETVATAWARARDQDNVSWEKVAQISERLGRSAARRTAFMLMALGFEAFVEQHFSWLSGRGASTPLDVSRGFGDDNNAHRDSRTGVVVNVPKGYLRAWLRGEVT